MKAIQIHAQGGPEVMQLDEIDLTAPAEGQVRVRHTAIGLNYIDTYHRSGLYPLPLPSGIGLEAAGVVEEVGAGVSNLSAGDRIAYGTGPLGAYAEARNVPAARVTKLPDSISDETGAAMMLKGMTVRYLLRETYEVQPGDTILWHAAAGGVGLIACQWAKAIGATVIGTVSTEDKAQLAKDNGCDHIIMYTHEDVAARVREITDGAGVPVVYDGIGAATVDASLDSLRPRGLLASFGNASGPIKDFDLGLLNTKGSLYVTRPSLMAYTAADEDLAANAADLVEMVGSGKVSIPVNQTYALADAVQAHTDLESRKTTGSSVLVP